jgi:cytochrome P450/geranylgeranyl pyrophosphate synthase
MKKDSQTEGTMPGDTGAEVGPARAVALKETKVVRGYPLVGGLVDILRDAPAYLTRIAREHPGEIVGFPFGPATAYLVTHPDHVRHVLHDEWRSFTKGGMWKATRPILGNGLVTSEGAFWLRQRRMMQPLFNAENLAALTGVMVDVIEREVTRLAARGSVTVDMGREMSALTQRVILETMLGQGIDRDETDRLGDEVQIATAHLLLRVLLYFLPERFPLPGDRRYRAAIASIDEAMLRLVRERRACGAERHDLLSLFLRARDEHTGEGMDDRQLRDELVTMFLAGHDTTASAMTWLWYELERHPEVERRLRDEVASVLGNRTPTFDDLARLAYTKQVIQEVMRLYPPTWMVPRFAHQEAIIGGHRVPAGSPMLLSPFVSHRDPAFWPEPEAFDPDRFTSERSARRPRYAYYPFGGGPRQCIGNHFATMEAQLITAMMVRRLRPRLVPGHRVVPAAVSSLKPRHGMKMTLGAVPTTRSAHQILTDAHSAVSPLLHEAVDRLPARIRRMAGVHFGWWSATGERTEKPYGKFLRPALVLLTCQAMGSPPADAVHAAAAVELVHNASLLQDDVFDHDTHRRGRPTISHLFGPDAAILTGDALFFSAVDTLARAEHPMPTCGVTTLTSCVQALLDGEYADLQLEQSNTAGLGDVTAVAELKTASLTETACRLGAMCAHIAPERVQHMAAFGRHFGSAFQMIDDILGIWGEEAATGKPVGSDLRRRKKSAPVAAALARGGSDTLLRLHDLYFQTEELTDDQITEVTALIETAGGRAWTERQARLDADNALTWLRHADPHPGPAAELETLLDLVLTRNT